MLHQPTDIQNSEYLISELLKLSLFTTLLDTLWFWSFQNGGESGKTEGSQGTLKCLMDPCMVRYGKIDSTESLREECLDISLIFHSDYRIQHFKNREDFYIPRQILFDYRKTFLWGLQQVLHGSAEPAKAWLNDIKGYTICLWYPVLTQNCTSKKLTRSNKFSFSHYWDNCTNLKHYYGVLGQTTFCWCTEDFGVNIVIVSKWVTGGQMFYYVDLLIWRYFKVS